MSETVLVTGGAGYIGSHACKALALAGYRPVAYDNLVHGHRWAVRWGPLEEGELADGERLDAVIQAHRPTPVLHFAAYTAAGGRVVGAGMIGTARRREAVRQGVHIPGGARN